MNLDIAVLLSWILAAALVLAVVLFAMNAMRRERARADALAADRDRREEALDHFATHTLPAITEAARRHETTTVAVEVPAGLENSRLAGFLQWIAERHAEDLRLLRNETAEQVALDAENRTRQAVRAAEDAVREEIAAAARDATSGAVRSFGTSVVSLGADVSQVVSGALRAHRDDEVYATLTRIDHTVQQMIRQAQSYVIVCGGLPGRRWPAQTLTDVVGGATGRVRDYLRVRTNQSERVVVSRAVEPLVHTLATLLDNALRYSPPTSFVDISFQEGHHGVTVIIDDAGVRMSPEQMEEARQILAGERPIDIHQLGPSPKVGFPGAAALARRYGFTVFIDGPNAYGGMRAMVYIPEALLAPVDSTAGTPATPAEAPAREAAPIRESAPAPEPAPVREPVAVAVAQAESEPVAHEITEGGLPKRRRREVAPPVVARTDTGSQPALARPDIAAAWHTGSKSGRAAADNTEGTR
ncbi:ATP-binding protein [Nocardia puris]|uniref:histidine kinase n=1 Tax=Nocardia puris TaxID=208602 RepID=A0A366DWH5_9NOCA|nr:sensor histidine kinase [Nocardia puris]RBO93634.1 signal transduction histidine kinase [Nocardia puris]